MKNPEKYKKIGEKNILEIQKKYRRDLWNLEKYSGNLEKYQW